MKAITFSMGNRLCNLRVSRQEACTKISEQIEKGNALPKSAQRLKERVFRTSRPGREPDDEHREKHDSLWSDYSRWGDFNKDLLNRLFDSPEIATEYSIPREPEATYGVLVAEIEEFENELKDDLQRLRSIKERLPLFEELRGTLRDQNAVNPTDGIVFVVHGRAETLLAQTQLLLQTLDLAQIVLRDQTERGSPTLIEKFERHAKSARYAVMLMTGDDEGRLRQKGTKLAARARQNIILELGYFAGVLGRENVCVLQESGVETPSNILGVEYVPIDQGGKWKFILAKKLSSAGFDVDLKKVV